MTPFRTSFSENIFYNKYAFGKDDTWDALAIRLVDDVCGTQGGRLTPLLSQSEIDAITKMIQDMKFIPGGRYLYYAGRAKHAFNNCFLLSGTEDTREEWAFLVQKATSCLMLGGGIGVDYSKFRGAGVPLVSTGGKASGPIPLMYMINEIGRNVMQGGSRRSALYASLNHQHSDIEQFLVSKNWHEQQIVGGYSVSDAKLANFNYAANLDMTNISVNYDDAWLKNPMSDVYLKNVRQALSTAEPGMSFNFGPKQNETLRNACQPAFATLLTRDGITTMGQINVGDEIWSGKGWVKVVKKWNNGVKSVYVYTTPAGQFIGTNDHNVIQNGERVEVRIAHSIDAENGGSGKIVSVDELGEHVVYDIMVDHEDHVYWTGGLIVSNCCEVTSEDDSDVCNLGSLNIDRIESLEEMRTITRLATTFLLCGTIRGELPYEQVYTIREKNRRLGLGLMGVHAWLLKRGSRYEVTPELHQWLQAYRDESNTASIAIADRLSVSRPIANRAIAPTGSIGILAATTTGIEPLFAAAYKRRYLTDGTEWKYEYVVDATTDHLVKEFGVDPDKIETALDLANDYERRIAFQADVQDYVDMAISSTINLPAWGSELNNEDTVVPFAETLAKYAPRLRGFTCYPDGARGGQPLTQVSYSEAVGNTGVVFSENDICVIGGKGGSCGV